MSKNSLETVLTREILEYNYNIYGNMQKVSTILNVSVDTISKYMKKYNISYSPHYKGIYTCNERFFLDDNEQSFYWAGFVAADGSLQKRKSSKILKLCLAQKDNNHLEKFKLSLNSNHPIKHYPIKPNKLIKTNNICVEIQIVNNLIFDSLNKFNIVPNKTKIYDMPDWILNHQLIHHYMRGYFDGDGCISHCGLSLGKTLQGNFSILGTLNFIRNYKSLLIKNIQLSDVKINNRNNIYEIKYAGNNNIRKLYYFLYKDATIFLDRKHNKFKMMLQNTNQMEH